MKCIYAAMMTLLLATRCWAEDVPSTDIPKVQKAAILEQFISPQVTANNLNARYKNTSDYCAENTSALNCSGVMLRRVTFDTTYDFWTHSPQAKALGSVTFSYIRSDSNSNGADIRSGFVLTDQNTAVAKGKALTLRCIYPFMAGTQAGNRPENGCGFRNIPTAKTDDPGTCAGLVVPAITAPLWIANYERFGSVRSNQCSLSVRDPGQFKASLLVRNQLQDPTANYSNELLIATWNEEAPEALPIEAFFYNVKVPGSLENAKALRDRYRDKTSLNIPLLALDFSAPDQNIFKWDVAYSQEGVAAAARLNVNYANTADECDGKAAYFCNGVIARTVLPNETFHAWDPSPKAISLGGVSFSYLRADVGTTVLAWDYIQGYVLKPLDATASENTYPLEVLCAYPSDAASWDRGEKGCGAHSRFPTNSRSCAQMRVTTVSEWYTFYTAVAGSGAFSARNQHQCSFGVDPESFALSIEVRTRLPEPNLQRPHHNELMVATWPQNIPQRLPIEAFVYHANTLLNYVGLEGAKFMQMDYYNVTGKVIPVIKIDLTGPGDSTFTYAQTDQSW